MKLGDIEVVPVLDGLLVSSVPATKTLPDRSSPEWHDQDGAIRPDGMYENTLGGFLVRTRDRVVLVDAGAGPALVGGYVPPRIDPDAPTDPLAAHFRAGGMGDAQIRAFAATVARYELTHGQLRSSLAEIGVSLDDVTDVVLTHLHFDHVGWVSADGAPVFPNATIRCASADVDFFFDGADHDWFTQQIFHAPSARDRLAPVSDRIETWDADGPLFPGVDVRLAPGHTPGSSVVVLSSGHERAMLLGDIVHCPLELMDDDFNLLADHDQVLANRIREAYARELESSGVAVAAAHFPGLRFGRLLPGTGGRRFTFDAV